MKYTPNLNLRKPAKTDPVLIDDLNDNMDILDQEVKNVRDTINQEVQGIRDTLDQEVQDIRDTLDQEVQDIQGVIDQEVRDVLDVLDQEVKDILDILDDLEDPVYHTTLTATLDTDDWTGTEAPFAQIQEVSGILATDVPIADVVLSGDWEVDQARLEAWGHIYRIVTSEDAITAYAREKPAVELPIQLKAVR